MPTHPARSLVPALTTALGLAVLAGCSGTSTSAGGSSTTSSTAGGGSPSASSRPSPIISGRLFGPEAHCLGPANCYLANPRRLTEPQVTAMLASLPGARSAPPGNGPWPFVLVGAPADGLPDRSGPSAQAPVVASEGTALDHRVIYAFCRVGTGAAAWYRIQSLVDASAGSYYLPASQLRPFHHDGQIPAC